jgi:hypothetical protein
VDDVDVMNGDKELRKGEGAKEERIWGMSNGEVFVVVVVAETDLRA